MGFWDNLTAGAAALLGLREASTLPTDFEDPDLLLPGNQAAQYWRRLTQSPADLAPLSHSRMLDIAAHLFDRNPLGKRILEVVKDYVIGEGVDVDSRDEDVQAAITRFWDDGQNNLDQRVHAITTELGLFGEQALAVFVNESSGAVRLASIDPRSIKAVIPAPGNPDIAHAISLLGTSAQEERYLKVIAEDDDPASPTFGQLVGAAPGETLQVGQQQVPYYVPQGLPGNQRLVGCFFVAINKVQAALRGRSDLLCIADFLDLYDRLVFDEAERMSFLRAFVWDVELKGNATAAECLAKANEIGTPPPGSVRVHNESEVWTALSPALGSADSQNTADLILSLIATGAGVPKHWLNGTMDINRASAFEMGEPALKRLGARQEVVVAFARRMVRFALDAAARAGALSRPADGEDWPFTVSAPEMSSRDLAKASQSLLTTVQALGTAKMNAWVDDETAQQAVVMGLGQYGLEVDLEEMQARIAADQAEQQQQDQLAYPIPFNQPPSNPPTGTTPQSGDLTRNGRVPAEPGQGRRFGT